MAAASTVEEYIGGFPPEVRVLLLRLRETIRQAVPEGVETISYDMPTVMVNGKRAIYWAAWKKHLAMYAAGHLSPALDREVEDYRTEKDTLQFPYRKEIPFELIGRLARYMADNPH
jgi:uncharacterized protein YdhG (YjbR/CyaY superfamily)